MKNVECIFIDDPSRETTEQIMNSVKGIDLLESSVEEFQLGENAILFTANHGKKATVKSIKL